MLPTQLRGRVRTCLKRSAAPVLLVLVSTAPTLTVESYAGESLQSALNSAYRHNPALLAQRKAVEATDEGVSQARSGFRPRVVTTADAGHRELRTQQTASVGGGSGAGDGSTKPRGYTIQISQSIFQGFQTVNAVKQAEANVLAAREVLRTAEQQTLLDGVTAYVDVIRDRAIVRLRENNVRVLSRELRASRERFAAGDVSRTDVAQSEARRAGAVSALDLAKSNLRTSEASYQQVIGHMPGALREPRLPQKNIPYTVTAGVRQAMEESPAVVNAAFLEQAAAHNIDQITGGLLPTVDLEADYTNRFATSAFTRQAETATFMARLNMPLYQGGEIYSRIRQARRTREQRAQEIENQRRIARQNAIRAWSVRTAAIAQLKSDKVQVRANQTALSGVRAEENVGQRSILDVLDAEQELLDARVSLVSTKRDLVVATYGLLGSVGRLTAQDIGLGVQLHDPEEHYGLVRSKPWGTRVTRGEDYSGYVAQSPDGTAPENRGLAEDVIRMAHEAHGWAVTEIHREDTFGRWDGVSTFEDDGHDLASYK